MDDDLTYKDVDRILAWVDATPELTEFSLKFGDLELRLSRGQGQAPCPARGGEGAMAPATAGYPLSEGAAQPGTPALAAPGGVAGVTGVTERSGGAGLAAGAGMAVKSPMVGTFYRACEPGAPPFVEIGQRVAADTTVCIIEVRKLMNSIPAGTAGIVRRIMVPDSAAVEYGQVLMEIEPAA